MNKKQSNKKCIQKIIDIFGREVGEIRKHSLRKHAFASTDMYASPDGWTWDMNILDYAESAGVEKTVIVDDEDQVKYVAYLADIWLYGIPVEGDFGPEILLPSEYWEVRNRR